jgi:hypothetical protein
MTNPPESIEEFTTWEYVRGWFADLWRAGLEVAAFAILALALAAAAGLFN